MTGGTPVSALPGLGPAVARACARAGIPNAETLRALGADAAYSRMMRAGERPHFIGYYALHMALQGRPWNDCKGPEKVALRARFDALKAAGGGGPTDASDSPPPALARFLRDIGLEGRDQGL